MQANTDRRPDSVQTVTFSEKLGSGRMVFLLVIVLLIGFACTDRSSVWWDCMDDAGFTVSQWVEDTGGSTMFSPRFVEITIMDPPPTRQMQVQSDRCLLEANGGVRVTRPVIETTLPPGLAGVFVACMAEAGYEVSNVEIVVPEGGYGAEGSSLSYGAIGPPIPEDVGRRCEQELRATP